MNKIEVLVDAIGRLNNYDRPTSLAYKYRSPLLLKSYAKPGRHEVDDDGRRIFSSSLAGLKASVFDMELKISGKSRAGLKPTDTLENLCRVYGRSDRGAVNEVVNFLRQALEDESLTSKTPLSHFLNNGEE